MRPGRPRTELAATELVAVVVAAPTGEPAVLTLGAAGGVPSLPCGPLRSDHRSLQAGLRSWVEQLTGRRLGYVEQLYTFADRERLGGQGRVISVSYLGLTHDPAGDPVPQAPRWQDWYAVFPWEDRRDGRGDELVAAIAERLSAWVDSAPALVAERALRTATIFAQDGSSWAPDLCLQRYELLYEAGLLAEARRAPRSPASLVTADGLALGTEMLHDHRRILATGMARLRSMIHYRPVIFELLPESFTLGQLQACVEAVSGRRVHTQNFRRLIQQKELVEGTGARTTATGGRPARLFRFRRQVLRERQVAGTTLPRPR